MRRMKRLSPLLTLLAAILLGLGVVACDGDDDTVVLEDDNGAFEEAGEAIDDAKDAVDEAAEETEEAVDPDDTGSDSSGH